MISVICVYNDENAYNMQLLTSLKFQEIPYELIGIRNTDNEFSSAAKALNYGAEQAGGDILIFSHQDIYFKTKDELAKLAQAIESCEAGTIVGTQGVKTKSNIYYTNLTSGEELDKAIIADYKEMLIEVSCVDEGLFGMKKDTWKQHKFNEILCNNWHLYCVEACLWAKKQGEKVFVCPLQIHHFSRGHISKSYMKGLIGLADYYRDTHKYIWTTCYKINTNWIYVRMLYLVWILYRKIRFKSVN